MNSTFKSLAFCLAISVSSSIGFTAAESASLAVGVANGDPSKGWKFGSGDTEKEALAACRGEIATSNKNAGIDNRPANNSTAEGACKIVGDITGRCYAFASDGTNKISATALGWIIADKEGDARAEAMSQCKASRPTHGACVLRFSDCR